MFHQGFSVAFFFLSNMIVYKKTDEWYNEWQRTSTSDNEWYNEWQRMTMSDNEWYNEWQRMTTGGTANENVWQRVVDRLTAKVSWRFQTYINNKNMLLCCNLPVCFAWCQEKIPPEKSSPWGFKGRVRVSLGIEHGGEGAFFRGDFFLEPFHTILHLLY